MSERVGGSARQRLLCRMGSAHSETHTRAERQMSRERRDASHLIAIASGAAPHRGPALSSGFCPAAVPCFPPRVCLHAWCLVCLALAASLSCAGRRAETTRLQSRSKATSPCETTAEGLARGALFKSPNTNSATASDGDVEWTSEWTNQDACIASGADKTEAEVPPLQCSATVLCSQ